VFTELTLINVAWTFSLTRPTLGVIWALGWSMVALAAFVWLPLRLVGVLAAATIALHNTLDGIHAGQLVDKAGNLTSNTADWIITVLHQKNQPVIYPLVPWIAVMALGYSIGPLFRWEAQPRVRALVWLGLGTTAAFMLLRVLNVYGDASAWSAQATSGFTVLSFLNTTKYPPSLLYLLMTLGPLFLALAAAEGLRGPVERILVVFGRAPFFYYVLHLFLIHAVAVALGVAQGFPATAFVGPFWKFPKEFGLGLGSIYLAWAGVVIALYFPSRWFAALKARRRDWWLSYL
jgi:uncharacterized membrane protein